MLLSCNNNTDVIPSTPPVNSNESDYFFVKDFNQDVIESLEPSLLKAVYNDLIQKERTDDAKGLLATYDIKSGKLFYNFKETALKNSQSGRVASAFIVMYDAHVANVGWQYNFVLGQVAGTEGQNKQMEAFRINTNPYSDLISYRAHVANKGWLPYVTSGSIAGTVNQHRSLQAIQINVSPLFGANVLYKAHVHNIGWQDWVGNNEIAGTVGQGKAMEAFILTMLVY